MVYSNGSRIEFSARYIGLDPTLHVDFKWVMRGAGWRTEFVEESSFIGPYYRVAVSPLSEPK